MAKRENHPLNEEFDIENPIFDDISIDVLIPEVISLTNISTLALQAYKSMVESIHMIPAEGRTAYMGVARQFLMESKDATYKAEVIRIKIATLTKAIGELTNKGNQPADATATETDSESGVITREQLMENRLRVVGDK